MLRFETLIAAAALITAFGWSTQVKPNLKTSDPSRLQLIPVPKTREELIKLIESMNVDLKKMNASEKAIFNGYSSIAAKGEHLAEQAKAAADLVLTKGSSRASIIEAVKKMRETQMSFNLQYLQLQSQMQHENRSYTAISNIMKTKHDTVKNSIGNIR